MIRIKERVKLNTIDSNTNFLTSIKQKEKKSYNKQKRKLTVNRATAHPFLLSTNSISGFSEPFSDVNVLPLTATSLIDIQMSTSIIH